MCPFYNSTFPLTLSILIGKNPKYIFSYVAYNSSAKTEIVLFNPPPSKSSIGHSTFQSNGMISNLA